MHYCSFSNIFFQPLTDAAEVLFKRCITPVEKTMEITYNYELLEHYSTEKHKTANAQNSAQTATNAQTVATSSFITPAATPQTTCPSWLSHMDQRKLEKKDDIPNHPLVLMVNMQAVSHNIVSLVSLGQCMPCYISCLL